MFAKNLHIENVINVAKPALGWISNDTLALHTAASLLMALACFALPLAIYYFLKKRQDLKQTSLILYPLLILLALNGVVYLAESSYLVGTCALAVVWAAQTCQCRVGRRHRGADLDSDS